jgi:hypothetical protein
MAINSTNIKLRGTIRATYGGAANDIKLSDYYRTGNNSGLVKEETLRYYDADYWLDKPPSSTGYQGNYTSANYARTTVIERWGPGATFWGVSIANQYVANTDITRTWRWGGTILQQTTTQNNPGTNEGVGPKIGSTTGGEGDRGNTDVGQPSTAYPNPTSGRWHYGTPGMVEPDGSSWPGFTNAPGGTGPNSVINQFLLVNGSTYVEERGVPGIGPVRKWTNIYALWRVRGLAQDLVAINKNVPNNATAPPNEEISFSDFIGGYKGNL